MLDVVLDTNIIISGLGWGGIPGKIIDLWKKGKINICLSAEVLEEYLELIDRVMSKAGESCDWFLRLIESGEHIRFVKPHRHFKIITADCDDNMFIDCAVESRSMYLITGDEHLLSVEKFKEVIIVSPAEFLGLYTRNHK